MWLGGERAVMVLDDVRQLPAAPLVVAEGSVISADLIDPARAVWLDARPWATADRETQCDVDLDVTVTAADAGPVMAPGH